MANIRRLAEIYFGGLEFPGHRKAFGGAFGAAIQLVRIAELIAINSMAHTKQSPVRFPRITDKKMSTSSNTKDFRFE